ncbi:hypothetical protein [Viridibacillus arvi]|uniref:hypothetical protein n=1 Tax=Viridibacillus arvi TaxID=263475 RepID=UPI0034CE40DA
MRLFNIIAFILWLLSIIMMLVDYHWGWLVAFIVTTIYFIIYFGGSGVGFNFIDIDIDIDL